MPSNNGYQELGSSSPLSNPRLTSTLRPLSVEEICARGSPPPPLQLEDKVVWLSDHGPEYGIVRWLGKLPDVGDDWMAGVYFVNPVGSGSGVYNDYKLFETKQGHASLVPIVGLIKASDYLGTSNINNKYFNILPPLKPKRSKNKNVEGSKFYVDNDQLVSSSSNKHINLADTKGESLPKDSSLEKLSKELVKLQTNSISPTPIDQSLVNDAPDRRKFHSQENEPSSVLIDLSTPKKSNDHHLATVTSNGMIHNSSKGPDSVRSESFEVGTVVEVLINGSPYYGVIKFLGFLKNDSGYSIDYIRVSDKNFEDVTAGIELEEEIAGLSDGTLNGRRYFDCPINKAYFVPLHQCSLDSRFCSISSSNEDALGNFKHSSTLFGSIDCPTVLGDIPPLSTEDDLTRLCGKNRGIQGHHNSCYLDATLFAMFCSSSIFESLLYRPKREGDIPEYNEVQRILKEEIANPLRANQYVRADRVMRLRELLERISSVRGLTSEEKDPEEFLNLLLNEILKTDPFIKLSSGLESFFYQLFVEKDENLQLPNVQQLFDQSFLASDIKLREVPPCLLIQMPRFGREFKMYPRIMPSLYLDITNVLDNSPRQCIVCGELAELECKECFGKFGEGLDSIAFCAGCLDKSHSHKKRSKHKATKLSIPSEFVMLKNHTTIPRIVMDLFAVLCIETSHYVSFVKCGTDSDSPWCFFDSMADRKGEQNGYNIPEVVSFPDLKWWLSEDGHNYLLNNKDDKLIPELPRRLLSDAYICFYSSEVLRYR